MGITMTLNAMHHESFVKRLYQYCGIVADMPVAAPTGCGLSTYLEMSGVLPRICPIDAATLDGCLLLLSSGNYMRPIDECRPSVIIAMYDLGDNSLDGDFQATFADIIPTQSLYRTLPASGRKPDHNFEAVYSTWTSSIADIDAGRVYKYVIAVIYRSDVTTTIAKRLRGDQHMSADHYMSADQQPDLTGELNTVAASEKLITLCFHASNCQRMITQDITPWSFHELVKHRDQNPTRPGFQAFDAAVAEFPNEYVVRNGEYKYVGGICVVMQMCVQAMRAHVLNAHANKILTAMRYVDSVASPGTSTISTDIWFNRGSELCATIRDVVFSGHIFVVKLCGENIVSLHKDIKTPTSGIYSISGRVRYVVSGCNNVIMHVYVAGPPESDDDMSD